MTDYTQGTVIERFYPFDHDQNVVLDDHHHRGFKANFYQNLKSERFSYEGIKGHLVIRKKYLVYNYTMIPLKVCDYLVVPGSFVGIKGNLTIQGIPKDKSCLKVVFN